MISVVIVNFNAGPLLSANITRIQHIAQHESLSIVIVDNGSTDNSLAAVQHLTKTSVLSINIIENLENRGFATAVNQGIRASDSQYVLCLNPDCLLEPDTLRFTREALEQNEHAGMAGALILNPDGSEQRGCRRDLPDVRNSALYLSGLSRVFPKRYRRLNFTGESLPAEPAEVPAISGAFMLVRREAISRVGLMDEAYFLHGEDLDWCRRFRDAGYKILFVPHARLTHHQGTCGRRIPINVEWHKHRGMWRYYRKFQAAQSGRLMNAAVASGIAVHFAARATKLTLRRQRTA